MANQTKAAGKSPKDAKAGNSKKPQTRDPKKGAQGKKRQGKLALAKGFLTGVLNELKKVHWPNRRESTIYTSVVVATVAIVSIMIWIFDLILGQVLKLIY